MEMTITPTHELETKLRGIVRTEFEQLRTSLTGLPSINDDKPLKRADLADMFGISLVTVHDWMKKGIITGYKVNGRTYFKREEVSNAMKQIKIRRKV